MSTLIFGAGAIGQWLGALLLSSGSQVQLHGRESVATTLKGHGGVILNENAPVPLPFSTTLEELTGKSFDTVICTVKTYAVEQALKELKESGAAVERLVSFQNGWGTERFYQESFPDTPLWAATTTRAVGMEEPGKLTPSSRGGLAIAPWNDETGIPECFKKVKIPLVKLARGQDLKWSKLLLNLIGNATGAVTGLAPRDLARHPLLMKTELELAREAIAVGRALGVERRNLPGFPVVALSAALDKLPVKLMAPVIASKLRGARGDKLPSLFFDLDDPTRPTELDELNGAVASEGARLGVPTPKQKALVDLFHLCRRDAQAWNAIRANPEKMLEYV